MPSGTEKPACSAIQRADRPTTSGFSLPSAQFAPWAVTPKTYSSSLAFSAALTTYAPSRSNSAMPWSYTSVSRMTACSEAQIMPLSKVLDRTMSCTARRSFALRVTYAGTLPAPTPSAGLPHE